MPNKFFAAGDFAPILEPLEDRIAPASATFSDVDGDIVKITTSKGTEQDISGAVTGGAHSVISKIDLSANPVFGGTSIKVFVSEKAPAGDGVVNVQAIDAGGHDLGSLEVSGDLAKLTVGDLKYANGSVKSVKVQSIGVNGGAVDKSWAMLGSTASFAVGGDVNGAQLSWSNPDAKGKLTVGSVTIGGNLIGGTSDFSGSVVLSTGAGGAAKLTSISVGGGLLASGFNRSGSILVGDTFNPANFSGEIGQVSVGGSLEGSWGNPFAGSIFAATLIGKASVAGSLFGGGDEGGSIYTAGKITGDVMIGGSLSGFIGSMSGSVIATKGILKSVVVGDSILGGAGFYSGAIASPQGSVGNVTIRTSVQGMNGVHSGSIYGETGLGNVQVGWFVKGGQIDYAGMIGTATGGNHKVGDITIGGDLEGGSGLSSGCIQGDTLGNLSIGHSLIGGSLAGTGSISASESFKSLFIGGDIVGSSKSSSASIKALGNSAKIAFVTIGGSITGGAGQDSGSLAINGAVSKFSLGGDITGGLGNGSAAIQLQDVGNLTVGGDVKGGGGTSSGSLLMNNGASLKIGGSLTGGSAASSGNLTFGTLSTLDIGKSVKGGAAGHTGLVIGDAVGKAHFGSNIIGSDASDTGKVELGAATDITIFGRIFGLDADDSGQLTISGKTGLKGKLTVGGIQGGDDFSNSGLVKIDGNANAIFINGGIAGGGTSKGSIVNSGAVLVTGGLKSITVGEDITAGKYFDTKTDVNLGAVRAGTIGSMLVKGSLLGPDNTSRVLITGEGNPLKNSGANPAIKSLTVMGSVKGAMILGGYNTVGTTIGGNGGTNGGAQIGTVTVYGDFSNGSIATGVNNQSLVPGNWADGTNTLLDAANQTVASIAKIIIKGATYGPIQCGFAAEQIQSISLGGLPVVIDPGAVNPQISQGDFYAQQIPG